MAGDLLIESGAIIETLLNRYGADKLRPAIQSPRHPA
jgi:glutathione S-transferase